MTRSRAVLNDDGSVGRRQFSTIRSRESLMIGRRNDLATTNLVSDILAKNGLEALDGAMMILAKKDSGTLLSIASGHISGVDGIVNSILRECDAEEIKKIEEAQTSRLEMADTNYHNAQKTLRIIGEFATSGELRPPEVTPLDNVIPIGHIRQPA